MAGSGRQWQRFRGSAACLDMVHCCSQSIGSLLFEVPTNRRCGAVPVANGRVRQQWAAPGRARQKTAAPGSARQRPAEPGRTEGPNPFAHTISWARPPANAKSRIRCKGSLRQFRFELGDLSLQPVLLAWTIFPLGVVYHCQGDGVAPRLSPIYRPTEIAEDKARGAQGTTASPTC